MPELCDELLESRELYVSAHASVNVSERRVGSVAVARECDRHETGDARETVVTGQTNQATKATGFD